MPLFARIARICPAEYAGGFAGNLTRVMFSVASMHAQAKPSQSPASATSSNRTMFP
jgi:hypothetical protein